MVLRPIIFPGGGYKLKETITKRFFRLFIPILVVDCIYFLAVKANIMTSTSVADITGSEWLRGMYSFEGGLRGFITDVYYRTMFCGSSQYNSALWTIAYLLYGSFLTAFILLVWGNMKRRWIVYLLFCVNLWIMGDQGTITCNYFMAFIIGMAIADWKEHTSLRIRNWFGMLLVLISVFFAGYPMGVAPTNIYRFLNIGEKAPVLWHVIGAGIMIFAVIYSEWIGKILRNKMIQFMGKISFSIYLIHMLVLCSFSTSLFRLLFENGMRYAVAFGVTLVLSLCVIIGAGYISYRVIEKNTNTLLSKMICIFDKNIVI